MKKVCTHPAICNGICLVCHEQVEGVKQPVERTAGETYSGESEQPAQAQETAKKPARKRAAK